MEMDIVVICHRVKSFTRRLQEWSTYLPKGTEFILVRYNVTGKTKISNTIAGVRKRKLNKLNKNYGTFT
jgi:hypothetical protein